MDLRDAIVRRATCTPWRPRDRPAARATPDAGSVDRSSRRGHAARRPPDPAFAHASEAELARILDFYAVRWEYEPHVFPILWNIDGDVVESFAPDFYLPDLDLYVEMTTLRQKLVRKKNRKLRRLRELYPDIRIKLFYARDFRALMLKYGRFALGRGAVRDARPGHPRAALRVPSRRSGRRARRGRDRRTAAGPPMPRCRTPRRIGRARI